MATIRHPTPIRLGEFHTVRLYRNLTQGSLVLDNHPPVNGTSQVSRGPGSAPRHPAGLEPSPAGKRGPRGWLALLLQLEWDVEGPQVTALTLFVRAGQVPGAGSERGAVPGWVSQLRRHRQDRPQQRFHR